MAPPLIMFIDDSAPIRKAAQVFLADTGYRVETYDDGFMGIAAIHDRMPDLVLLDLMMPGLDGYQTCRLIKSNPGYAHIPIVVLSSNDGVFDRAESKLAGCDEHLAKPFTKSSLIAVVERYAPQAAA